MSQLNESQELLLCKFHDRECSWLESMRAKRLLKGSAEARLFMNELSHSGALVREVVRSEAVELGEPNLWTRVSVRLHQEDRAGSRGSSFGGTPSEIAVTGGKQWFRVWPVLVGATCAGVAAFALLPMRDTRTGPVAVNGTPNRPLTNQASRNEPIRLIEKRIPSSVSVDWMKSDGRVVMMHESQEGAPVLWVKRRDSARRAESRMGGTMRQQLGAPSYSAPMTYGGSVAPTLRGYPGGSGAGERGLE